MTYSSSLNKYYGPLVLDTSVLINIYESGFGREIITSLPNDIYITQNVIDELVRQDNSNNKQRVFWEKMISTGRVQIIDLNMQEETLFVEMVTSVNSLGDGESSTIAVSMTRKFAIVIDEKRGRRKTYEKNSESKIYYSLDMIHNSSVSTTLGPDLVKKAIFNALSKGRMRINEADCDKVVEIIGPQKALLCKSLPGYKTKRFDWEQSV